MEEEYNEEMEKNTWVKNEKQDLTGTNAVFKVSDFI